MRNAILKTAIAAQGIKERTIAKLCCRRGEGFVDTAVKVIMVLVIGALILGAMYLMFKDTIIPTIQQRIEDMFNYKG